jgi:hypothetical protein
MELLEEVKKNPTVENLHLFDHHLLNLDEDIHLKGVELL